MKENTRENKKEHAKEIINNKSYNIFTYTFEFVYISVSLIPKIVGIYFLWVVLHYVTSHLYIYFCVPRTFYGFLISPFLVTAPHCQALRWCLHYGSNIINTMWITFAEWIYSKIHI